MTLLLDCFFVGAGGALGAISRFLLGLLPIKAASGLPVVTLGVNVAGAFAIGLIVALSEKQPGFDPRLLLFLKVGLCGGFTTFSTFSHETVQLLQAGKAALALLYMSLSFLLCIAAILAAQSLVK